MPAAPTIPGYELHRPLGGGPLTQVFAGFEHATNRPCAIKLIRDDCRDMAAAIELMRREARAGMQVRHPHLVHVRHAKVDGAPFYIVMDLLGGETLRRRLDRDYRIQSADAVWMMRQTGEALAALHRAHFIHGDFKPDNIRLIDNGTAVLIDLGFTHRAGENAMLRRRGYFLGTANYLAPECCSGDQDASPESDLFSFGVTLFEILTGELPYPAGTSEQTLRRHAWDPPLGLHRCRPDVPAPIVNLVSRLLDRRPTARPTASRVVAQLIALELAMIGRRSA